MSLILIMTDKLLGIVMAILLEPKGGLSHEFWKYHYFCNICVVLYYFFQT